MVESGGHLLHHHKEDALRFLRNGPLPPTDIPESRHRNHQWLHYERLCPRDSCRFDVPWFQDDHTGGVRPGQVARTAQGKPIRHGDQVRRRREASDCSYLSKKASREGSSSGPDREIGTDTRSLATGSEEPLAATADLTSLNTGQHSSARLLLPYDQAKLSSRALPAYSMKSACG